MLRNNSGALPNPDNPDGPRIRFGLGNDSKQANARRKSSDFIGVKPVLITQEMVGQIIGQFVAIEIKKPGWVYRATKKELAQYEFFVKIARYGAIGQFATCPEDLIII